MNQPSANYSHKRIFFVVWIAIAILISWLLRHIYALVSPSHANTLNLSVLWIVTFLALAYNSILALIERPARVNENEQAILNKLKVTVLVPAYNEDPKLLLECLKSMSNQTRMPNVVCVVDDGSNIVDYTDLKALIESEYKGRIELHWKRTENRGKRYAQMMGVVMSPKADIYITVDSDTILDHKAIEEGLKPFKDKEVLSVAGVVLPLNNDKNLLTRFSGVWEMNSQLIDRNGQSLFNSVMVNSGCLALYRGHLIRYYLKPYLRETFFGRRVKFSDDSLLTTYALQHGKTVQQATAISFSSTPEKISHHIRRYIRWMRGSFIRTWWRFKYLDILSYAYWLHIFKWFQTFLSIYVFWYLAYNGAYTNPKLIPYLILIPILVTYGQSLCILTIRRSDQTLKNQIINYLLSPITILWSSTVLRVYRWYSYLTCLNTGWGTRKKVEVKA